MSNEKTKAYAIVIGILAYFLLLYFYATQATKVIENSGLFMGILVYLIYQPAYLIILYYTHKVFQRKVWKELLASLFLIFALDMVAMPRFLLSENIMNGAVSTQNIGSIVISRLDAFLPHSISHFSFYVVLPAFFIILSAWLLGIVKFKKQLERVA